MEIGAVEISAFTVATAYALVGALFAMGFVVRGAAALAPGARGGSLGFRLMILPGAVLLWPYLAVRWLRVARRPS